MQIDFILPDAPNQVEAYNTNLAIRGTGNRPTSITLQQQLARSPNPGCLPVSLEVINRCPTSTTSNPHAAEENLLGHPARCDLQHLATTYNKIQQDVQSSYPPPDFTSEACDGTKETITAGLTRYAKASGHKYVIINVLVSFGSDEPLSTLVDTGSTFSLIDYEVALARISNFINLFEKITTQPLVLGDDITTMKPLGVVRNVEFFFSGEHQLLIASTADFIVMNSLPEQCVLGHQYFLHARTKTEISYSEQCLKIGRKKVPWRYSQTVPNQSKFLRCAASTNVPAHSLTRVPLQVQGALPDANVWGYFSDISPTGSDMSLIEAFGHLSRTGRIDLWVLNRQDVPLVVEPGILLGIFDQEDYQEYGIYASEQSFEAYTPYS